MAKIRDDFEGVTFVYDEDANAKMLQAGDEIPDWASVGKHLLAQDEHTDNSNGSDTAADSVGELVEPPRQGRGSGKEAWQEYATALGVSFPKDATKGQVIELVDAATADAGDHDDGQGGDDDADAGDPDQPADDDSGA